MLTIITIKWGILNDVKYFTPRIIAHSDRRPQKLICPLEVTLKMTLFWAPGWMKSAVFILYLGFYV